MSKPYAGQIPFDLDGEFMRYAEPWRESTITWRDNEVFEALLTFEGFERGRSAAYARLHDHNGRTVYMFLSHLEESILNRGFVDGKHLTGWWTWGKRGQNYGIAPTDPPKENS